MALEVILLTHCALLLASHRSEMQKDKRHTSCDAPYRQALMFKPRTFSHSLRNNIFFFWRNSPTVGHGLLINVVSRSHTTTHRSR